MTTYLSPGVYIEEIPSGPQPIAAVSPSTLAIIGTTARGPINTPTRVTGWGDYAARFGGAVPGVFTAEAVAGFFENGGRAAYVVRVDPSRISRWTARTATDGNAFTIEASSPGAWANSLGVVVIPSRSGGVGSPWSSMGSGAANNAVSVGAVAGLKAGDTIITLDGKTATVDSISGNTLGLNVTNGVIADFNGQLLIDQANATKIGLATNPGIETGDILEVVVPGERTSHHRVTSIEPVPSGFELEFATAADVPGGAVAPRLAHYSANLTTANLTQANIAHFDFGNRAAPEQGEMKDGMRATFRNGVAAEWSVDHFELSDTNSLNAARLPVGPVDIEGPILVTVYGETGLTLDNPTPASLAEQFGWVPDGLQLQLFKGGVAKVVIEKSSTAFTVSGAGTLNDVFDEVRYKPRPKDAIVTSPHAIHEKDIWKLATGDVTVKTVDPIGGDRYHIVLESGTVKQDDKGVVEAFQTTKVVPYRFGLVVTDGSSEIERHVELALPESHSRYFARDGIVNQVSQSIRVLGPPAGVEFSDMPQRADQVQTGDRAVAGAQNLIDGFGLLEAEAEPALLVCPDLLTLGDPALQGAVVGAMTRHAERFRRFAIVDLPRESDDQELVDWRLEHVNSIYAAAYAPHVRILNLDPEATERFRWVPPSGSIAGVYARTDAERGFFKAPANEQVAGIVGLDQNYSQRRQDLLNPNGVNVIRTFPGRGRRIWGARTASTDTQWRYVNVRRLFNVIETSAERGTEWVVFEPNTSSTWLRVRTSVENFLYGIWQAGGLAGNSPEEAYRVRVGLGETMTQAQIDLGEIVIRVAVAPSKPAEFVVFQFSHLQKTDQR